MNTPFRGCDLSKQRTNIVFYYPSGRFRRHADEVADNLQAAFEVMAAQYPPSHGVDYGDFFRGTGRIVVGYRRSEQQHAGDGQGDVDQHENVCAGYSPCDHRINIPWDYLGHGENSHGFEVGLDFQPEYCCGHELGHPFEAIRLHGNPNQEEWKEGLCDFGRLLLLRLWASRHSEFRPISEQYEHYLSTVDPTGKGDGENERRCHYAARLILNWYRKTTRDLCLRQVNDLFNGDMNQILGSWRNSP